MLLKTENTLLLVIDVQGKLAQIMYERDALFENLAKLIKGAHVLGIPLLPTEQNPDRLGPTVPDIASLFRAPAIPKLSFSCCGQRRFVLELEKLDRRQVMVSGIEGHICVYQTVMDLLAMGCDVHVVADAVSSRTRANRDIGLQKMKAAGAAVTSVETALFELLGVAEGDKFKGILEIVK